MAFENFERDFRTDYDINAPELAERWEEVVEELHTSGCPVAHSTVGEGYWVLNRYEDIRQCAQNWETFSSTSGFMPNRPEGMPFWYPVECDPPFHDQLRSAINPFLGPKAMAAIEPGIKAFADELIDGFIDKGEVDAVEGYSNNLPGLVFCGLVANMPLDDMPFLQKTLNAGLLGPIDGRAGAMQSAQEYIDAFMRKRQEEPPKDDVVNAILNVELDGYEWADRTGTLSQLTLGGVGTTGHVIASGLYHFAGHPEDRRRFMEEPEIRPKAVEELVRFYASSPHDGRRVNDDIEVGGVQIKKGDFVLFGYGAGSRDPLAAANPTVVDFERSPSRHVAFGAGVHRCIGSHLARLQIRIAWETFMERIPEFSVPDGFKPPHEMGITRSMLSLPLAFGNGAAPSA